MIASLRWFVLLCVIMSGCATTPGENAGELSAVQGQPAGMEQQWGIRILRIALTAEGNMLDFRYRVIDAEKAAPLFSRQHKAYLVDEATGAKFLVPESPKVGALRTTREPKPDRNYFIIFVNPGRYIKKGNKVTVVIGDFKAEHLVVE